ncbi:hypothetical protein A0H81_14323 [Grifola frondosa]|uniref:Uncharacterized protein n=1 Tax=Grifola frondosa TaxID=5627 RepID=A0A1C7LMH9_GRIFR|nr:hypothetical protein A0H81_14323 [Grifola frondosa]
MPSRIATSWEDSTSSSGLPGSIGGGARFTRWRNTSGFCPSPALANSPNFLSCLFDDFDAQSSCAFGQRSTCQRVMFKDVVIKECKKKRQRETHNEPDEELVDVF